MKTVALYEFLARWREGALSGWHVQLLTTHTDDATGEKISEAVSHAMTPAQAQELGFSLEEILSQEHVDALKRCNDLEAQLSATDALLAEAVAARDAEKDSAATATAAHDAALVECTLLQQQLAEACKPELQKRREALQAELARVEGALAGG